MHIAVEATKLLRDHRGIGRYVRNLLREIPPLRPDVRFTLYVRRSSDLEPMREEMKTLGISGRGEAVVVRELRRTSADVVWYPWNWIPYRARTAAMVVTIHDVAPMLQLDHRWWRYYKRWKYRTRFRQTVSSAHTILADSEFTASEVGRLLGVARDRMRVVPLAADDFISATGSDDVAIDHLVGATPFFLAVGAHDQRKNLDVLFEAVARLHGRGERVDLVMCGPGKGIAGQAGAHDAPWLRWAGYVSDRELATLYRRATALVFPSWYEGFGLPALEAMAAGGCVVCADASSLPEVAGDAALLFPPDDPNALAHELLRLLHSTELRSTLIARGLAQAARFQWKETARQTLAGFEAAIDTRRTGAISSVGNADSNTYSDRPA